MIEGLVTGTLMGMAEQRQGKNDTSFVVAKVKATPGEGESLIVNVIAFATEACAALLALDEGDTAGGLRGADAEGLDRQARQHPAGAGHGGESGADGLSGRPQARGPWRLRRQFGFLTAHLD